MEKTYRITLDIRAHINEKIKGASNKQTREYTREIINCFLSDPQIYDRYYSILIPEEYLPSDVWEDIGEPLDLEKFNESLLLLSKKVSPEAGRYLLELIYSHPQDPVQFETNDKNLDLIYQHLNNFKVIHLDISEIKNEKNVPEKNTIMVEAGADTEAEIQGLSL